MYLIQSQRLLCPFVVKTTAREFIVAPKSHSGRGRPRVKTTKPRLPSTSPSVEHDKPTTVPRSPSVSPNRPIPSSSEFSSSDSDELSAYSQLKSAYNHPKMSSNLATVEHPVTKHCPIITGGDLTPQTLLLAENTFNEFFIAKGVPTEDEIKLILGTFKDVHIRDWIATDRERLLGLTFSEFMSEVRTNFLPSDWVESVRMSLLGMRMTRNTKFWDYAQGVRALNIVLRGTASYLEEPTLRNQLEAGLETGLQSECAREELYKLTTLKEWIERVRKIDEHLAFERKRYREIFTEESNLRASKPPALGTSRGP